ncbi:unnamed protein product [Protopolystoma xenopodis]|uniref:Uncharacterized protein n=1 Tax=Protopolystoma xenopodis TaxID=117903 RepID=A0A448WUM6_9PLAT|nr:unnamed protein product [Protopolystoma xenopodis]
MNFEVFGTSSLNSDKLDKDPSHLHNCTFCFDAGLNQALFNSLAGLMRRRATTFNRQLQQRRQRYLSSDDDEFSRDRAAGSTIAGAAEDDDFSDDELVTGDNSLVDKEATDGATATVTKPASKGVPLGTSLGQHLEPQGADEEDLTTERQRSLTALLYLRAMSFSFALTDSFMSQAIEHLEEEGEKQSKEESED